MSKKSCHEKSTQGADKLRNYFLDIIEKNSFQKEVAQIRISYNIPRKGFRESTNHIQTGYSPRYPKKWSQPSGEPQDGFWIEFFSILKKLCNKFKIPVNDINIIYSYVLYNKIVNIDEISGLCMTQDFCDIGKIKYTDKEHATSFPILIRISPYASQRDILDYIKSAYLKEIAPMQKKYKDSSVMLGKIRAKKESIKKRDAFVIKNQNKPLKKIRELLREHNYELLDEGHIGKIISLNKKKRN